MKYVECGQQRLAVAAAILVALFVASVAIAIGIAIDDWMGDIR